MDRKRFSIPMLVVLVACGTGCYGSESGGASGWDLTNGDIGGWNRPDAIDGPADVDAGPGPDPIDADTPDIASDADPTPDAADTDVCSPQTSEDCDIDGLLDCEERELGTEVCNPDTDGDGIRDMDEVVGPTDPLDSDTDGDGASDGAERSVDLDPTNPDSFGDGVRDGDRWLVGACDAPRAGYTHVDRNDGVGRWTHTLPRGYDNRRRLAIGTSSSTNLLAASVYGDPTSEVAGFLLSTAAQPEVATPEALMQTRKDVLASLGTVADDFITGEFDGRRALQARYLLRPDSATTVRWLRDQILTGVAPFDRDDAVGWFTPSGETHDEFHVFVTTFTRAQTSGPDQVFTLVALAPIGSYEANPALEATLGELTAPESVGVFSTAPGRARCRTFWAKPEPRADFYFVLDQSGSMHQNYRRLQAAARHFSNRLRASELDYRFGVASMIEHERGKLRPVAGWHDDVTTLRQEIEAVINLTGSMSVMNAEYGFKVAKQGIAFMRNLTGQESPGAMAIRPDTELLTIFVSDEDPRSLVGLDADERDRRVDSYSSFFERESRVFSIVANGDGCGVVDGAAYRQAAYYTAGATSSLCSESMASTLANVAEYAALTSSPYTLGGDVIPSSIEVYVEGQRVPKSRVDGFDYSPVTNSIAFFGSYRPENNPNLTPDGIAVYYQNFR